MECDVPKALRRMFEPQVEQLHMNPRKRRNGLSAHLDENMGSGGVWVVNVGTGCLFTALDVTLRSSVSMEDCSGAYACLGHMSRANIQGTPLAGHAALMDENLVTFSQSESLGRYQLEGGVRYASRSLCMTADFFDQLGKRCPDGAHLLHESICTPTANVLPDEISTLLCSFDPSDADRPDCKRRLSMMLARVTSSVLEGIRTTSEARDASGGISSRQLADDACRIMRKSMAHHITVASLARDLCVSRASLAAIFKEETGMGVAECLRHIRMERAMQLLETTELGIAEVGASVGYPRQSSFTEAFKHHYGYSPSLARQVIR